mgnify:CR=1 FL=1
MVVTKKKYIYIYIYYFVEYIHVSKVVSWFTVEKKKEKNIE